MAKGDAVVVVEVGFVVVVAIISPPDPLPPYDDYVSILYKSSSMRLST